MNQSVKAKPKSAIEQRFDRVDQYCDELEALIGASSVGFDEDITGQIERSVAGLEIFEGGKRAVR